MRRPEIARWSAPLLLAALIGTTSEPAQPVPPPQPAPSPHQSEANVYLPPHVYYVPPAHHQTQPQNFN